jgi:hypothetical protein
VTAKMRRVGKGDLRLKAFTTKSTTERDIGRGINHTEDSETERRALVTGIETDVRWDIEAVVESAESQ